MLSYIYIPFYIYIPLALIVVAQAVINMLFRQRVKRLLHESLSFNALETRYILVKKITSDDLTGVEVRKIYMRPEQAVFGIDSWENAQKLAALVNLGLELYAKEALPKR